MSTNVITINASTTSPQAQVAALNDRFDQAVKLGKKSDREKLLVFASGFIFVTQNGGVESEEIRSLLIYAGINNKVDQYNRVAQLILGLSVEKITDKKDKKDARNVVGRLAKLYQALTAALEANPTMAYWSEDRLADYIDFNGGIDGMLDIYLPKDDDAEDDEAYALDLAEFNVALSSTPIRVPLAEGIRGPDPVMSVCQLINGQLHLVPLADLPVNQLAALSAYLPAPDANLAEGVRFWVNVGLACSMFDRQASDEPARPDEEQHVGSARLPSLPIVLVRDGDLSIAASRVTAGPVVMVTAHHDAVVKMLGKVEGTHLNGRETKALIAAVAAPRQRAMYERVKFAEEASKLTLVSRDSRVADLTTRFRPMVAFGSSKHSRQWTNVVRPEFDAGVAATLTMEPGVLPKDLIKFAEKVGAGRHDVAVKLIKGALSLAQGAEANPIKFESEGNGSATAVVSRIDFARAMAFAAQVKAVAMTIAVDPKGLVLLQLETAVAKYGILMPTLLDGGARSPALLEQVSRPA